MIDFHDVEDALVRQMAAKITVHAQDSGYPYQARYLLLKGTNDTTDTTSDEPYSLAVEADTPQEAVQGVIAMLYAWLHNPHDPFLEETVGDVKNYAYVRAPSGGDVAAGTEGAVKTTMRDPLARETYSQSYEAVGSAMTLGAKVSEGAGFNVGDKIAIGSLRGAVTGADGGQLSVALFEPVTLARAKPWAKDPAPPAV